MEFSLDQLLTDLGIGAKVDELLENERRYYHGNYVIKDPDDIAAINSLYSKSALLPTDPVNYTYFSGDPANLARVPILEGYGVLLTWDVFNDEPRTGQAGWIYKSSFDETCKCSSSPLPGSRVRFRMWKRIQVKLEELEFAKFLISESNDTKYSRYHSYNVNLIHAALSGIPYKLQLVYENRVISSKSEVDDMSTDPPYWTCPMYSGYKRQSGHENSNCNSNIDSNSNSNSNSASEGGQPTNIHSLDVDNYSDLNEIVADGFKKYNAKYVSKCYPYCEIRDGTNYVIPPNWTVCRGFNFVVNSKTDLNGWQYADSFWLADMDGSKLLDSSGNRVEQPDWYISNQVETDRYMENLSTSVATFKGVIRSSTVDSKESVLLTRSRANTGTSDHKSTKQPRKFKRPIDFFRHKLATQQSRDQDHYTEKDLADNPHVLTDMKVKRRLWCRVLCPKAMFAKTNSMFNTFVNHHPRGMFFKGALNKRGAVINNWRERTMELRDNTIMYFKNATKKGTINITNGSLRKVNARELEEYNKAKSDPISKIQRALSIGSRPEFIYGFIVESSELETDKLFNDCGVVQKLSTIDEDIEDIEEDVGDDISVSDDGSIGGDPERGGRANINSLGIGVRKYRNLSVGSSISSSINKQTYSSSLGLTSPPLGISKSTHDEMNEKERERERISRAFIKAADKDKKNKSDAQAGNERRISSIDEEGMYSRSMLHEDLVQQIPSANPNKPRAPSIALYNPVGQANSFLSYHSKNSSASTQSKTSLLSVWSMQAAGIDCVELLMLAKNEKSRTMWCELIQSQIALSSLFKIFDVDGAPAFFPTTPTELVMDESDGPLLEITNESKKKNMQKTREKVTTNDLIHKLDLQTNPMFFGKVLDRKDSGLGYTDVHFEFEEYVYYSRQKSIRLKAQEDTKRALEEAKKPTNVAPVYAEKIMVAKVDTDKKGMKVKKTNELDKTVSAIGNILQRVGSGIKHEIVEVMDDEGQSSEDDIKIGVKDTKKHEKNGGKIAAASATAPEKVDTNFVVTKQGVNIPVSWIKGEWCRKKFVDETSFKERYVWLDQNNHGHWCIYWAKEAKKPKYPDVPKGFAVKEIESCTVGALKENRKGRPMLRLASQEEVARTVCIWLKSHVVMLGIDIQFPTEQHALKYCEVIVALMKN